MTRTDASPDYLHAFLSHHLQVCERATVLACLRPDEDFAAVKEVCDSYGERVALVVSRHHIFDCWRTLSELRKISHNIAPRFVLHIDKDEFIADFTQFPVWCSRIDRHEIDCVVGATTWRMAPGCNSYDVSRATSFEDLDLIAPIRTWQGSTKCFLTGGDILLHEPTPGGRVASLTQPVEHFAFSADFVERAKVKSNQPDREAHKYMRRALKLANFSHMDRLQLLAAPRLSLRSADLLGWTNYVDILRSAAKFLPDGGTYIETGVFCGKSLGYLAEFLQVIGKTAKVIGYDTFDTSFTATKKIAGFQPATSEEWVASTRANLKKVAPWNTPEVIQCDGAEAAQLHEDASVDFVWLDSSHEEEHVRNEILAWLPKLKPSGVLAGHDLAATHPGVEAGLLAAGVKFESISKTSWIRQSDVPKLESVSNGKSA